MIDHSDLQQNHLLAALPAAELSRISEGIAIAPMPLGHVLYESGDEMRHVYFPTTSIVSLLYVSGRRLFGRNRHRRQRG